MRAQMAPKMDLKSVLGGSLGVFFMILGCLFWVLFLGQMGSSGDPKIKLVGTKSAQEAPKCCSGGGSRKRSKIERKQGPKMSDFWEARTSKIVLPCRLRAYFAKTGRRGNCHEKGPT